MAGQEGRLTLKEEEEDGEGWEHGSSDYRESNFSEWRDGREQEAEPVFPLDTPTHLRRPELSLRSLHCTL